MPEYEQRLLSLAQRIDGRWWLLEHRDLSHCGLRLDLDAANQVIATVIETAR